MMDNTNKLLDTMAQIILMVHTNPYLKALNDEQLMTWVKEQLNDNGFPVVSVGACWLYMREVR